ncbi:MAG: YneF family protein [Solobacterium sp.]|nr:YneF family protein [Solobacterium sp.]
MTEFWSTLLWFLAGAAISALITFFVSKKYFEKQLKEHPPIDEKMIRAMFMQMGRKPSEAQIRQVMKNLTK